MIQNKQSNIFRVVCSSNKEYNNAMRKNRDKDTQIALTKRFLSKLCDEYSQSQKKISEKIDTWRS